MKAPYEHGKMKGFPEKATEWIATAGKRCTDVFRCPTTVNWHSLRKPDNMDTRVLLIRVTVLKIIRFRLYLICVSYAADKVVQHFLVIIIFISCKLNPLVASECCTSSYDYPRVSTSSYPVWWRYLLSTANSVEKASEEGETPLSTVRCLLVLS